MFHYTDYQDGQRIIDLAIHIGGYAWFTHTWTSSGLWQIYMTQDTYETLRRNDWL